jgi:hypothetical protein
MKRNTLACRVATISALRRVRVLRYFYKEMCKIDISFLVLKLLERRGFIKMEQGDSQVASFTLVTAGAFLIDRVTPKLPHLEALSMPANARASYDAIVSRVPGGNGRKCLAICIDGRHDDRPYHTTTGTVIVG